MFYLHIWVHYFAFFLSFVSRNVFLPLLFNSSLLFTLVFCVSPFVLLAAFCLSFPLSACIFLISIYPLCISLFLFLSSFFLLLYLFSLVLFFLYSLSVMWRDSIGLHSSSLDTQPFNFNTKTRNSALKTKHKYGSTQHGCITYCRITVPFCIAIRYPRKKFRLSQITICIHSTHTAVQTYWSVRQKKTCIVFQRLLILYVIHATSGVSSVLRSLRLLIFLRHWPHFTRC